MRTIMAGLTEFERDLIRERVKSGLAAAKARSIVLGRQEGQRPSNKKAKKVLAMHREGLSYRLIGRNVGLSKNTVMEIVRRGAAACRSPRSLVINTRSSLLRRSSWSESRHKRL